MAKSKRSAKGLKVQSIFDASQGKDIKERSDRYGVSNAEVVRGGAYRTYQWSCEQFGRGLDVGARDPVTGEFIAFALPYAERKTPKSD